MEGVTYMRMSTVVRTLLASLLLGMVLILGTGMKARSSAIAAYSPRVIMYDNNLIFQGGDPATGMWGFFPDHLAVVQGETITFDNPASNNFPHTVTSITASGAAPTRTLTAGDKFDSSPSRDLYVMPGSSFQLDTTSLAPGRYEYFCTIHPWMLGTFTVMAPAS
jgi:plastocyanin